MSQAVKQNNLQVMTNEEVDHNRIDELEAIDAALDRSQATIEFTPKARSSPLTVIF